MTGESAGSTLRIHLLPFALFAILALAWIGSNPLDLAEASLLTRSSLPLGDFALTQYSPLYLLILHLWSEVSEHATWLRGLGVGFGAASILLGPWVLRGLGGTHATRAAFWLLAASPFLIGHVRVLSTSQLSLLTVMCAYLCFIEYNRAGQLGWLAGWVLSILAALLTHGGLYCVALVHCLAMVVYRRRFHQRQRNWWLAQIPVLCLFAILSGAQLGHFVGHRISETNTAISASVQWAQLGTGLPLPWSAIAGGLMLLLLASGAAVCRDWRRNPRHGLLLIGCGVPTLTWLVWLPYDFYAVAALPCLVTLAAMGTRLYPRWARQVLWCAVAVTYGWSHWRLLT